jgi:hypothetical protein
MTLKPGFNTVVEGFRISPSSYALWVKDKRCWWARYVSKNSEREPQGKPQSAGSAFDAYVKGALYQDILGIKDMFEKLFLDSVEPQNRDEARSVGANLFQRYIEVGAYADIVADMRDATEIHMEVSIKGENIYGIPSTGKPDLWYIGKDKVTIVVHDWKVNGFYSKSGTSPKPGYVRSKAEAAHGGRTKLLTSTMHPALTLPVGSEYLDTAAGAEWPQQITQYGWMLGTEEVLGSIHQLTFRNGSMRVTEYAGLINPTFRETLKQGLTQMWIDITDGHPFKELEYDACQKVLEQYKNPEYVAQFATFESW